MDNYPDSFFADNEQEQLPLPYEVKLNKKKSPYADTDYVTPFDSEPEFEMHFKPEKKKKRSGGKFWKGFLCTVLIIALVAGCCVATAYWVDRYWSQKYTLFAEAMDKKLQTMQEQMQDLEPVIPSGTVAPTEGAMTPGQVYKKNVGAVVAVSNQAITTNIYGQVSETASSGSGFIVSPDGYVVSNYHVVEGATKLTVITSDGTEYEAKLIGYDETNDISLMKIDVQELPYVTIGSSDDLVVGDQVVAIGNPLGELTSTLTVGYISAKDRVVTTEGTTLNMLQTDAAINSGNSGGPLFNMNGEVIGITTAKFSGTSNSGASIEGIGFAIPVDDIVGMLQDLKDFGYVTGAYLGVMVRDVDATAQSYGLPAGAYIQEVMEGYAAERAGLKAQDIIINLGGYDVTSVTALTRVLRKFEANETTTVTVYRAGQRVNLSITLDEKPVETTKQEPEVQQPQQPQQQQPSQDENPWGFSDPFGFLDPFFPFG